VTQQRVLVAIAIAAGLLAGLLYWNGARRTGVVVAAADLVPGAPLALADLETRQLPPDALPAGAIGDPARVAGRYLRAPMSRGQLVLASSLLDAPAAFDSGVALPTGYRAVAIPVDAAHALGGAIVPGSRVDVIAVPAQGHTQPERLTEVVAPAALVIDIRGDQGGAFERQSVGAHTATTVRERLGSVVVAVGPSAELLIADRTGSSTFVLALVPSR
jgi:pilus assembly protein CpaB